MGMNPSPDPESNSDRDDDNGDSPSNSQPNDSTSASAFEMILVEFSTRWARGENPRVEDYLDRLTKDDPGEIVELAYHEFRLAENDGLKPSIDEYTKRFPKQAEALFRLFSLHDAFRSNSQRLWSEEGDDSLLLPVVGDSIGPYRLIKDLGRGAFAKVFLAEQTNLDDRLIVVKLSTKITQEPHLLARASHPNIVEVVTATMVNDDAFQLICMPFLGGATLSALLAERRKTGVRPHSGNDILDDIDRIQPAGYPSSVSKRPAREILSKLSYQRAIAWIVARLAEGLHHAYSRCVLHGDVKPSNILITADGNPMLLDFNLSVGWQVDPSGPHGKNIAEDPGGTLAYMAPERLKSVADGAGSELAKLPKAADRHRADIYSLGVVLLESLTGKTPDMPSAGKAVSPREIASAYFSSRLHDGKVMIRSARGTSLPADLKEILRHCLAPDSADRYRDASELAADLDRWLRDRPLLFARKTKGLPAVNRWFRRNRIAVALASVALIAMITATTVYRIHDIKRRLAHAIEHNDQTIDSRTSGTFFLRRAGSRKIRGPGDPAEIATAILRRYDVIDNPEWRSNDDVYYLPADLREELEALILEQIFRLSHALRQKQETPIDWKQLSIFFSRVSRTSRYRPLVDEIEKLQGKFEGRIESKEEGIDTPSGPTVTWINEYLEGVASELNGEGKKALDRFLGVKKSRPNSILANYRAAAVAFSLIATDGAKMSETASQCLKVCVDQRQKNALLRHQYATCLLMEKKFGEAQVEYGEALKLNPNNPETYLSRAFLWLRLGRIEDFVSDMKAYQSLTDDNAPVIDNETIDVYNGDQKFSNQLRIQRPLTNDPEADALMWAALGELLYYAGQHDVALQQINRAYALKPESIRIRYMRTILLLLLKGPNWEKELVSLANDPEFRSFTENYYHDGVYIYYRAADRLIFLGKTAEALGPARLGVTIADRFAVMQALCHFVLAHALALEAMKNPELIAEANRELKIAHSYDPQKVESWFLQVAVFRDERFHLD